jgi:hypothetical protein
MSRFALFIVLLAPTVASAQDMPLFTFTKPGEGWVKADGKKPSIDHTEKAQGNAKAREYPEVCGSKFTLYLRNRSSILKSVPSNKFEEERHWPDDNSHPSALVATPDGGTVYVGFSSEAAVWAFTPDEAGKLTNGAPYAPLRVRKAYDNSKDARIKLNTDPPRLAVTALSLDSAGRLYAATEQDLQVFDPTGRLSGVLTLPEKGKVETMAWEGKEKDTLAVWVGEQKWTRKMNPSGR